MSKNKVNIARMNIRYLNSSTLGDYLEVRTGVLDKTEQTIIFGQRIAFQESGQVIGEVTTEVEFRDEHDNLSTIPLQVLDATLAVLQNSANGRS